MRRVIGIVVLVWVALQVVAQDTQRINERDLIGTARYVGMAGAMTAVGGDASAILDNPAALGVYQKLEIGVSLDVQLDYTRQQNSDRNTIGNTTGANLSNTGVVFDFLNSRGGNVIYNNVSFGYARVKNFRRDYYAIDDNGRLKLNEYGGMHRFNFSYGMNVVDCFYWGVGLNLLSLRYEKDVDARTADGSDYYSNDLMTGLGMTLSTGVIGRPTEWLRLGASIETPARLAFHVTDYYETYLREDGKKVEYDAISSDYKEYVPMRLSAGVAFQAKRYGLLSLQYDLAHSKYLTDVHTLRVGLEGVVKHHWFLNLGYAYESTFKQEVPVRYVVDEERSDCDWRSIRHSQHASAGFGYQGKRFVARMAYQYRWQGVELYENRIGADTGVGYDMKTGTHRIVMTLAWTR